ncbi:MAG TPA: hypothetical protein DCS83_03450 [Prevotella sp.]|nr:hypothetical protein [Prevotella sp.]
MIPQFILGSCRHSDKANCKEG